MRVPNFEPLSQAIRHVSACFESREDFQSLQIAKDQLEALRNSDIYLQIPEEEKKVVEASLERLTRLLLK